MADAESAEKAKQEKLAAARKRVGRDTAHQQESA